MGAPAGTNSRVRPMWTVPGLGLAMMLMPPGGFVMGEKQYNVTEVWLTRPFWLGMYEVTQGQWLALMGRTPSFFKGAGKNAPVENVSWEDAIVFCRRLTEREGAAGRLPPGYEYTLPTEAQWEYACRASSATTKFNWGDTFEVGRANMGNNSSASVSAGENVSIPEFKKRNLPVGSTMAVGQFEPNAWGLYDMHGNVLEWCLDWYADKYSGGSVTDPMGPPSGTFRVCRGGGWSDAADYCRTAYRSKFSPGISNRHLGFRVVLSPVAGGGRPW